MKTLFTREFHTLHTGQLLSGIAHQGKNLHVVHGNVWLTVEGELDDYWLAAGDSLALPAGRNIVLEADGGASVVETSNLATTSSQPSFWARLTAGLKLPGQPVTTARCQA